MTQKRLGNSSLFPKKNHRKQGVISDDGNVSWEQARRRLCKLAKRDRVSDGDLIEYLARGEAATRRHLRAKTLANTA